MDEWNCKNSDEVKIKIPKLIFITVRLGALVVTLSVTVLLIVHLAINNQEKYVSLRKNN